VACNASDREQWQDKTHAPHFIDGATAIVLQDGVGIDAQVRVRVRADQHLADVRVDLAAAEALLQIVHKRGLCVRTPNFSQRDFSQRARPSSAQETAHVQAIEACMEMTHLGEIRKHDRVCPAILDAAVVRHVPHTKKKRLTLAERVQTHLGVR
jgi:hypothetical protein